MAGINDAFWDRLDARIGATLVRAPSRRRPPAASFLPAGDGTTDRHRVSDWTGLVDTISAAGAAAHEQSAAYESLASDLRRALADVERYKTLILQAQAEAETKTREIQALAEARIEAIQAKADARVQRAEERARHADRRAVVVEDWLAEFEQASRALLPRPREAA